VRLQQLARDFEIFHLFDTQHDDGQVAGDSLCPQAMWAARAALDGFARRPGESVQEQDAAREPLEQVCLRDVQSEMAQLHLCLCPRQCRGAHVRVGIAMFVE
jgi:hypothetical protein